MVFFGKVKLSFGGYDRHVAMQHTHAPVGLVQNNGGRAAHVSP